MSVAFAIRQKQQHCAKPGVPVRATSFLALRNFLVDMLHRRAYRPSQNLVHINGPSQPVNGTE